MSEKEDPATTIIRLLKSEMRVIKDNGGLATVNVSGEWQNADAFEDYDGQVTVGLAESVDQKVELSGKIRRRMSLLRANVWATDKLNASDNGKTTRGKIVEEIDRIIRQNRSQPNDTLYDFVGAGPGGQAYRAFNGNSEASPDAGWTEVSDSQYVQLWYSDDSRCTVSIGESGDFATLLFCFKLDCRENAVKQLILSFEGYGTAPLGNGVTVKVWNHTVSAWENAQSGGVGGADEVLSITLASGLPNFIDASGYVWFFARTTNSSDGVSPAVLRCDYVSCAVTVNGITYCDVSSYRNLDRTDVKPFVYRTEFILKSWFFENIGV